MSQRIKSKGKSKRRRPSLKALLAFMSFQVVTEGMSLFYAYALLTNPSQLQLKFNQFQSILSQPSQLSSFAPFFAVALLIVFAFVAYGSFSRLCA